MEFPTIIDNRSPEGNLAAVLKEMVLPYSSRLQVAVGYFYYSGFELIAPALQANPLLKEAESAPSGLFRIIMSPRTDRYTARLLTHEERKRRLSVEALVKDIQEDLAGSDFQHADFFLDLLARGILDVRLYTEDFFHAKAYLAAVNLMNGTHYYSIVGSSNFSASGFTDNRELNVTHSGALHYQHLLSWFENIWASNTVELNAKLIRIVESERASRSRKAPSRVALSPFELYLYLIRHYLGNLTQERLDRADLLAEFQQVGAENVLGKLDILGGAIVSDSVGLGKTFTAGEVVRRFREQNARVLIVAPPTLLPQWKETLRDSFHIPESEYVQFLSQGKLSQVAEDQVQDLKGKHPFDLIVVDEAHRARNAGTRLYRNLQRLQPDASDKRSSMLLLTATPFNNSIRDLQNLVYLCTTQPRLYAAGFTPNAFDRFHEKMQAARKSQKSPEEDRDFQKAVEEIHSILSGIMLLRMRSSIKRRYKDVSIAGKPLTFHDPEVRKVEYRYSWEHHTLFEELSAFLAGLHLPHIVLSNPESGRALSGLFVLLLFKRIESSLYAFYCSLQNIMDREEELLQLSQASTSIDDLLKEYNRYRLQKDTLDLEEADLYSEAEEADPLQFDMDDIREWIASDLQAIQEFIARHLKPLMLDESEPMTLVDPKLDALRERFAQERFRKCLVFTEYRDTARYLEFHLTRGQNSPTLRAAMVTSGDPDMAGKLARFAPRGQKKDVAAADELDVLIATEVLAEGVNLQDADMLLNFDLPWNPMRIVQRVGRVNRIGSEGRVTVLNFTPADEILTQFLGLVKILTAKVKQVALLLGKEMAILSSAEETIEIKEIGAELQNVRNAASIDEIESLSHKARLFQDVEGETEEDHFRASLQFSALKHQIRSDDFAALPVTQRSYYTVLSEEPEQVFTLYEIYGRRGDHRDLLSRHWLAMSWNEKQNKPEMQPDPTLPYEFIAKRHSPEADSRIPGPRAATFDALIEEKCSGLLAERRQRFRPGAAGHKLREIKARLQNDLLVVLAKVSREAELPGVIGIHEVLSELGARPGLLGELQEILGRHSFGQSQLSYLRQGLVKAGIALDRGVSPPQYRDFGAVIIDFYNKHIISDATLRGSIYREQEIEGRLVLTLYM